ncbi:unnamed protein product [Gemmataceae bacterium]|nr:unnamed protein product [Gemmataceae bacterium]VTU01075.1 unnamed protein product [Gemmataceae bacterium]
MLNKLALAAALVVLATPTDASAYGAVHRGYTHVGPGGVYHTGATAVAGPRGVAVAGRTTAVGAGGGVYRSGYGAGVNSFGGYGAYGYRGVGGVGPAWGYNTGLGSNYRTNTAAAVANGLYR